MPPSRTRCCARRSPQHGIPQALDGLLPTHPQYAAFKAALAATPASDEARRDRIRLNLDRWRWLPRDLGDKYIIVNVPGLPRDAGRERRQPLEAASDRRQAVDADAAAQCDGDRRHAQSWWDVPKSIENEAAGKKGFVPVKGPDGEIQRWRQPPGPTNALGQIKFVMPNSKAIYLHDTNARSRFNERHARA